MYSLSLLKRAVHPASHSCPMDSSDPDTRCGKCVSCVLLVGAGENLGGLRVLNALFVCWGGGR